MARNAQGLWLSSCWRHSTVSSISRSLLVGAFALTFLFSTAQQAHATPVTVTVGFISFDQYFAAPADGGPGVSAVLDVQNLTGGGIDFDGNGIVVPAISFLNLAASLVDSLGSTTMFNGLGTLTANNVLTDATGAPPILVPDTQQLVSAVLTGTIDPFTVLLADGNVFSVAQAFAFSTTLLPTVGSFLVPGQDLALITVTGDVAPPDTSVPEPSTILLVAAGAAVALRRRSKPQSTFRTR